MADFPTASWGRRILALFVDWAISTLVVLGFVGLDRYGEPGSGAQGYTLLVYVMEATVLTWLGGGSIGKILTGLCVVPAEGPLRRLNPLKLFVRQVLVILVIPPLVFRPDGRGLHDVAAGTATVTFGTLAKLRGA
ncbi:putative RDD family membrane protein YckC [Nocardioides thalensis]|uniref:Putative RDD family membrane protein YckC n=1 Tax=Nocardioides thalensis TaxID=1914755 RepID=A0A853C664_9ACTN|nr:putative RDD family membrane protein YckC [Nocardioides thalensis]